MRTAASLALALLLSPAIIVAQESAPSSTSSAPAAVATHAAAGRGSRTALGWISGGLGANSVGIGGSANLSVQYGPTIVSLRATSASEGIVFSNENVSEVAAVVGVGTTGSGAGHASVGVGVGRASGTRYHYGNLWSDNWVDAQPLGPALGLAWEAQVFLRSSAIGIGLYAYGDINSAQSFSGLSLCLQLGKLK
jgi:hypothetical protein